MKTMAIEYPREHDVGDSLVYIEKKTPGLFEIRDPFVKKSFD